MPTTPEPATEPEPPSPGSDPADGARSLLRGGARALGLLLLIFVAWVWVRGMADPHGYLSVDPAVLFAMGLVGAGVLLLRGQQPVYEELGTTALEPKKGSPLGILTLSVVFLVVGLMILLGNLEAADITIGHMAAAGLFVVGLGLLLGAWWGRSRFLIVVGIVMIPIVVAGGFMHFPLRGSLGDRWISSRSIDNVGSRHELLIGSMYLNLPGLRSFEGEREIDISIAAGNATIFVPERIGLTITGHIEWGNAAIGHGRESGHDLVLANDIEGKPGAGHLTINFRGGIASLYIERISHLERHGPRREGRREERIRERPAERRKERRAEQREQERRRAREQTRD